MPTETMVYVAADPTQPGAAWAICVDEPAYAKDTAATIAKWIKRGAHVMRVEHTVGCDMLDRWVRPEKR